MSRIEVKAVTRGAASGEKWRENVRKYTPHEVPVRYFINKRKRGLASIYNDFLDEAAEKGLEILVLMHDDAYPIEGGWVESLREQMDGYDAVGVAGSKVIVPWMPFWMIYPNRCCGAVINHQGQGVIYGPTPSNVACFDGLFMAIMVNSGLRFDPEVAPGFHAYDLDFCLNAIQVGKRLGVVRLPIRHDSKGGYSNAWVDAAPAFIRKWAVEREMWEVVEVD